MAVTGKGVSYGGKGSMTIAKGLRTGKLSQAAIRRGLAAQRKAGGAAGVARAMTGWGLKQKGNRNASKTGKLRAKGKSKVRATAKHRRIAFGGIADDLAAMKRARERHKDHANLHAWNFSFCHT